MPYHAFAIYDSETTAPHRIAGQEMCPARIVSA
jgi:hypothetical protein